MFPAVIPSARVVMKRLNPRRVLVCVSIVISTWTLLELMDMTGRATCDRYDNDSGSLALLSRSLADTGNQTGRVKPFNPPWSCDYCFPWVYKVLDKPSDVCKRYDVNQVIDLVFLIPSSHNEFDRRDAVRQTWASYSKNNTSNFRHVFFLGVTNDTVLTRQAVEEARLFRDLVTLDFMDSYTNLTLKTLMMLNWLTQECSQARFFLKVDNDMWVNVGVLMARLEEAGEVLHTAMAGYCPMSTGVIRDTSNKWGASWKNYPSDKYPCYCSGTAYASTVNVAKNIVRVSRDVPYFFLEDVFVGLCLKQLRFAVRGVDGFYMDHFGWVKRDPCVAWSAKIITQHRLGPRDLFHYWNMECVTEKKVWMPRVVQWSRQNNTRSNVH